METFVTDTKESHHVEASRVKGLSEEDSQFLASLDDEFKKKVPRKVYNAL